MSSTSYNSNSRIAPRLPQSSAEETLQLIARLPAPEGLEDRVQAGLKTAPAHGRILHWPVLSAPDGKLDARSSRGSRLFLWSPAGDGASTSRVQPIQPAKVIVMPAQAQARDSQAPEPCAPRKPSTGRCCRACNPAD